MGSERRSTPRRDQTLFLDSVVESLGRNITALGESGSVSEDTINNPEALLQAIGLSPFKEWLAGGARVDHDAIVFAERSLDIESPEELARVGGFFMQHVERTWSAPLFTRVLNQLRREVRTDLKLNDGMKIKNIVASTQLKAIDTCISTPDIMDWLFRNQDERPTADDLMPVVVEATMLNMAAMITNEAITKIYRDDDSDLARANLN